MLLPLKLLLLKTANSKPKSVAKPEITNMRHLENILSKSREKSLLNIKRQDKSLLQTDT